MINIPLTFSDDSVVLKQDHVYECVNCGALCLGSQVRKNIRTGERVCRVCKVWVLRDITGSTKAVEYLRWLRNV
jgi:hypothetical protein